LQIPTSLSYEIAAELLSGLPVNRNTVLWTAVYNSWSKGDLFN